MPVHLNTIGYFQFLSMEGPPFLRQEQLELIERAGVDGTAVRKTGKRSKPFEIVTLNYEASLQSAHNKMLEYKAMVGDDPVEWVRHSVSEGTWLVLEVRERERYAIFNSLGGLVGGEQCCHVVSWTLLG